MCVCLCNLQTTVTYEMSHSCAYLEMCIMESLRMFPPIAR